MAKNVKLYSTPTCPYCIGLKQFLKEKNVDFQDIDVSSDQSAVEEMKQKTGQMSVPALDIEGQIIIGFDEQAIANALGL
ncbi:MAG: glutaredoxin family protein [Candidatus Omnitrophica bacterium]|nr:glutaredoxin family protein [Candidatus Omnitrophota bacterium]